jgi:hypothetical protein
VAEVIGNFLPSQNNNSHSGIVVDQNQIIDTVTFPFLGQFVKIKERG